jgi:hypothetical protein
VVQHDRGQHAAAVLSAKLKSAVSSLARLHLSGVTPCDAAGLSGSGLLCGTGTAGPVATTLAMEGALKAIGATGMRAACVSRTRTQQPFCRITALIAGVGVQVQLLPQNAKTPTGKPVFGVYIGGGIAPFAVRMSLPSGTPIPLPSVS